jgi:hypothetical protein
MRKVLALCTALALAMPIVASAQGKADFSGTWTLDEAKSDPAPARGGGGGGGGGGGRGGGRGAPAAKIVITQASGAITIESHTAAGAQTAIYKLDGSESVNKTALGESKTKASWDGSKLVLSGSQQIETPNGTFDITTKDTYSLEGSTLVLQTQRTTGRGDVSRKLVYNKG